MNGEVVIPDVYWLEFNWCHCFGIYIYIMWYGILKIWNNDENVFNKFSFTNYHLSLSCHLSSSWFSWKSIIVPIIWVAFCNCRLALTNHIPAGQYKVQLVVVLDTEVHRLIDHTLSDLGLIFFADLRLGLDSVGLGFFRNRFNKWVDKHGSKGVAWIW